MDIGKIYIVATPIGNLEDITFRAVKILGEVEVIFAEDTRNTLHLLEHYRIEKQLISYHQHSLLAKKEQILQYLLQGKSVALVTDAGTPGISDPGNELIDFLLESLPSGTIIPVPGASSLTAALSVCGFNVNKFVFLGFFPRKKRTKLLNWITDGRLSFAFFESPYRLTKTLKEIGEVVGYDTRLMVARELTKIHETLYRGSFTEVLTQLESPIDKNDRLKGEVVVVVES